MKQQTQRRCDSGMRRHCCLSAFLGVFSTSSAPPSSPRFQFPLSLPPPTRSPVSSHNLFSAMFVSLTAFGRRKGADEYTLVTSKCHLVVSSKRTVFAGLKANYWIESCKVRRKNGLGTKGCPHWGLVMQRHRAPELAKA